jgi:hypothetical protein
VIVYIFGLIGCSDDGGSRGVPNESRGTSQGPEISSVTANPSTVKVNETSQLMCMASHPEGYPLEYIWVPTRGAISGSGSRVNWIAPDSAGPSTVICKVIDSSGKQDTSDVEIEVTEHEEDGNVLLDTTVSLSENSTCRYWDEDNGWVTGQSCYNKRFSAETGKVVTLSATGPSNMYIDLIVQNNSTDQLVATATHSGSVNLIFTPPQTGSYRLLIFDKKRIGGVVHIIVTEE